LPFFDDPVVSNYHRIHSFENGKSVFTAVDNSLQPVSGKTTEVTRDENSHKLIDGISDYSVTFSSSSVSGDKPFAFIGNPFMTTIDFEKIYEASENQIKNSFQIWTGEGFAVYAKDGPSGTVSESIEDPYIAPQQAFLVEKADGVEIQEYTFNFTLEGFSASQAQAVPLRSSSLPVDKLDIVASNAQSSVLTFIAKREYGSLTFGNSDTRKLVTAVNAMPEIYSLKESTAGLIAAGSSVINTDMALVPLGLSTSWEGNMTLTFKGMDRYNAQIKFVDFVAGQEIDLTDKTSYEYPFEYTPAKDADQKPVANESRFFIQFTPAVPTQLTGISEMIKVYTDKQAIYVVSSDKIRQVFIYDLQGSLVYADRRVNASYLSIAKKFSRPEVYIVKVATEKGIKNIKLINH
jgi:hypothetical protein